MRRAGGGGGGGHGGRGGRGCCGSRAETRGFDGQRVGEHLWRYLLCCLVIGKPGLLGNNSHLGQNASTFSETCYISRQFAASEKRSLLGIVEKDVSGPSAGVQGHHLSTVGNKMKPVWPPPVRQRRLSPVLSRLVLSLFTSLKVKQLSVGASPALKHSLCLSSNRNHNL